MNAVEIEEAVSALALAPFDRAEFPYAFLAAFGNKDTTIQRLRSGNTNQSDIPGGVLQRNNIHLAVCDTGRVPATLTALRASPKNTKAKPKFVFATDGVEFEAEELATGEVTGLRKLADLGNHFGFFLPLAGISTVAEIKNNPIDIKATSRLNKLYLELQKENPDWTTPARRQELNQFMARLIFCFFAEDTGIFISQGLFTNYVKQMTSPDGSNTHEVLQELFRAMDTPTRHNNVPDDRYRIGAGIRTSARVFPYVNGKLFSGKTDCPRFSKIARSYLTRAGELSWKEINPDIFGSMIQAVADADERGELGMHYTSVPNILKVLDPLFLDDLREELEKAEGNARKLLNLRKRIANIRVFDPACGSGNFLVIAYIKLREIEAEIIKRRGEQGDMFAQKSWIKLTNFYGIEIKSFAAEIARLSLLIAEFQCNVRLIGQREACLDVLPLHDTGRIVTGNALRLDWLEVCPPPKQPSLVEEDLGGPTGRLALDAKEPEVETYICGNPPYTGSKKSADSEKDDLAQVFSKYIQKYKTLDLVAAWIWKSLKFLEGSTGRAAFVATKSICQGEQAAQFWLPFFSEGGTIRFAYRPFTWANLASRNAGVTCVIVGIDRAPTLKGAIFDASERMEVKQIGPYLIQMPRIAAAKLSSPSHSLGAMSFGDHPYYGGDLIIEDAEATELKRQNAPEARFLLPIYGTTELTSGLPRHCFWIADQFYPEAKAIPSLAHRFMAVQSERQSKIKDAAALRLAELPYRFRDQQTGVDHIAVIGRHSSESREYLPFDYFRKPVVVSDAAFFAMRPHLFMLAVYASRLHTQWISTVCGRIRTDYRYSNTLGWNTFPVPPLTENQKADLTRCAEDILLAREHYWPATIADMYDPDRMDTEFPLVRQAHEKNDETLERIYIGRRFKNDTERLEKLFDMYTKMTAAEAAKAPAKAGRKAKPTNESPSA